MFKQSVLGDERGCRPFSFLASITAELVIVIALILIPLAYHDHLPDFHWRSVGVGAPVRPLQPKPIARQTLRGGSGSLAIPRAFVESSLPRPQASAVATEALILWDTPGKDISFGVPGPATGHIIDVAAAITAAPPPAIREPRPPAPLSAPIRVSAGVQSAKLVKKVVPEYPPLAKAARVSGAVHLLGVIARDGTIKNLQLVSGHPLLARAALDSVRQWIYRPTLLNGEPVEVIAPIEVYFTLGQ